MKLHLLSDLHLEFAPFRPMDAKPLHIDADVVVLAGDICPSIRGVQWAKDSFADKPVIYVPGNHEAYGTVLSENIRAMRNEAAGSNVYILDNDSLVIDGVRFLGTTLWTDFDVDGEVWRDIAMLQCRSKIADFWSIYTAPDMAFTPYLSRELHVAARDWLSSQLATPFAGPTVVVTHHGCSNRSIPARFLNSYLNGAFTSKLDRLLGADRCALWFHGHTHDSFDYDEEGTRVIVNPRGYCKSNFHETRPLNAPVIEKCENPNFNPYLVVEIL